jgi:hypothetical protein
MARVDRRDEWTTSMTLDVTAQVISRLMADGRQRVKRTSPTSFLIRGGSERTLGSWFVNVESLPRRAFIELVPAGQGTYVRALIEECMGLGWLDAKVRSYYDEMFAAWMYRLRQALPETETRALAGGQRNIATQLVQLAELRDQGSITDEEFTAAKASLLVGDN